jgi:predicted type IV restriction endonuclease
MTIPQKVDRRILEGTQRYRPILEQARARDVNESDTVTIVKGLLADVFGWNPFFEVTSEYAIRSTYCDLAVKTDDQIRYLIEVKAIGSDLRDNHLRQAINYAANYGIEWVVLTNGSNWQAHRVTFAKPIGHDLVFELDFLHGNPRDANFRATAFLLSKEGMTKSAIAQYHQERLALSKFNAAAIIRSEAVVAVVRRELRRAFPALNPSVEQVRELLETEVLKREVVEGEKADAAAKLMRKATRLLRKTKAGTAGEPVES